MQHEPKHFESLYPETTRETELGELVHFIREGNSSQLIGIAGVGRSSILGLLAYNKEVRLKHFPKNHGIVHFVVINFSELRRRPLVDVMKLFFLSLSDSLRERQMDEEYGVVDALLKEAMSYQDELVLSKGLKKAVEYLSLEKKLTIIFLFDRFDEYVPFLTVEFFTNLRSLRDSVKYRFSVIFSLARPLEDQIEPTLLADFSDFVTGHYVFMKLYDPPSIEFRLAYLEKLTGKSLGRSVVEEIILLTGGHIRLTNLAAEAVLAASVAPDNLHIFLSQQKTIENALISIWQQLTPSEQTALLQRGRGEQNDTLNYLQQVGLLKGHELSMPLFESFLENVRMNRKSDEEDLSYDEATNTILRGDTVLSDTLTKAEFKLLRYLLQHKEQIVDREAIVTAVWQDTTTTVGVTEQAIDQLVFRLRRKIEKDPNNPLHLQTIKGRGIKFSS